jgi:acyl carrier protein
MTPAPGPLVAAGACRRLVEPLGRAANRGSPIMVAAWNDGEEVDATLRSVLVDVLGLDRAQVRGFDATTPLFGALPEFDSMAVAGLLTELEERLGIFIEDHEVDADMLETFGSLLSFARAKALQ